MKHAIRKVVKKWNLFRYSAVHKSSLVQILDLMSPHLHSQCHVLTNVQLK